MIAKVRAFARGRSMLALSTRRPDANWIVRNGDVVRFAHPVGVLVPDHRKRTRIADLGPAGGLTSAAYILGIELRRESFERRVATIQAEHVPTYILTALHILSEEFLQPGDPLDQSCPWQLALTEDDGEQAVSIEGCFIGINRIGSVG